MKAPLGGYAYSSVAHAAEIAEWVEYLGLIYEAGYCSKLAAWAVTRDFYGLAQGGRGSLGKKGSQL